MSIEVKHERNGQADALEAVLGLLAAEQAAEQAAQSPEAALLEQLAPLVDRTRQGAPQSQSPGVYGAEPAARQVRQRAEPSYYSPSAANARYRTAASQQNNRDRLANQDMLAQFNARELAQRQADDDARQREMEEFRQAELLARQAQDDLPDWLQRGLNDGSYKNSPEQDRQIAQTQNTIHRLYNDPTFTPAERARYEAQLRQRIRDIKMAAEFVPQHKRPLTPQQQFEQSIVVGTDPAIGEKVGGYMGMSRSGVPQFFPFKKQSDPAQAAKDRAAIKLENDKHLAQWKVQHGLAGPKPKDRGSEYDTAIKNLMQKHGYDAEPYSPTSEDIAAEIELRAQFDEPQPSLEIADPMSAMLNDMGMPGLQSSAPAPTGPRPVWETMPTSDAGSVGPASRFFDPTSGLVKEGVQDGTTRYAKFYVPVSSPEELAQLQLPSGTPIILPDGRTGKAN